MLGFTIVRMYSDCTPIVLRMYSECTLTVGCMAFVAWRTCGTRSVRINTFLDERRFGQDVVPCATQCVWYDGSAVPINYAQNRPGQPGHPAAPVFVTTKLADLKDLAWWAADDPQIGHPRNGDASMIMRRLKVYSYEHRIPKPRPRLPFCGRCFAHMVLNGGNPLPRP